MYRFEAPLWRYEGDAGWHFVTLPGDLADDITARTAGSRRGFGSVRVRVTVGATSWATSLFPDAKLGTYLLPVKKQARDAEGLVEGATVSVVLEVVEG